MQKIFGKKDKGLGQIDVPPRRTLSKGPEQAEEFPVPPPTVARNGHDHPDRMSASSQQPQANGGAQKEGDGQVTRPKLVFHCQQAQGSPTGLISGFSNVKELYQKVADCYGFPVDDILFCTLNTHRIDMDNLLSAQLCLDDFIFIHRKGTKKEVEITKTEDALGLTITDNGMGYAFIKRIKDGSVVDRVKVVNVGDHIEKIDGESLVGWRHVDVAKYLKSIPVGKTFIMRLVEPLRAGFANIGPKSDGRKGPKYGSGKETLRFRSNGPAKIVEAPGDVEGKAIDRINSLLENFMGINDADLASQIWDIAEGKQNTMEFAEALDNSELESFGFTDDFVIEIWGIVTDARSGRLPISEGDEQNDDFSHLTNPKKRDRPSRLQ